LPVDTVLIDANILLYAVDERSRFHRRAGEWLTGVLDGEQRVGIPRLSLVAVVRIVTHPRANDRPLTPDEAAQIVLAWVEVDVVWHLEPGPRHADPMRLAPCALLSRRSGR